MNRQKVLVAGATGFIGRNLTERLSNYPEFDLHAVHFKSAQYECPNVTWHQADLRNPKDIERVMVGTDILIQAAATTSGSKDIVTTPEMHVTDNAVMNSYLLRAAHQHQLKHVIFFSCTVMYQNSEKPLKESDFDPAQPLHPKYFGVGHTKLYVENLCKFFANISETCFTVIRHSNIYGPHDKYDLNHSHVFGASVTKVMTANDKIYVWGTGQEGRDLLYVDDLVDFVETAIRKRESGFQLYNCGSGTAVTINQLVSQIISASRKQLKIEYDLSKPTIETSLSIECSRAKEKLAWQPRTTLETGIAKTIEWWKKNVGTFETSD